LPPCEQGAVHTSFPGAHSAFQPTTVEPPVFGPLSWACTRRTDAFNPGPNWLPTGVGNRATSASSSSALGPCLLVLWRSPTLTSPHRCPDASRAGSASSHRTQCPLHRCPMQGAAQTTYLSGSQATSACLRQPAGATSFASPTRLIEGCHHRVHARAKWRV
jgi:hypothetical protein